MTPQKCYETDFADHVLTIEKDDGLFRVLSWRNPETYNYACRIITWPNGLTLAGDVGTFTVCHPNVKDILAWFPSSRGYLAEKIKCHGAHNELTTFSQELAVDTIDRELEDIKCQHTDDEGELDEETYRKDPDVIALESLKEDVQADEINETQFIERLMSIDSAAWEYDFQDLTWKFELQCLAVEGARAAYYEAKEMLKKSTSRKDRKEGFDAHGRPMDESRYWWADDDVSQVARQNHKRLVRHLRKYGAADLGWNYRPHPTKPAVEGDWLTIIYDGNNELIKWSYGDGHFHVDAWDHGSHPVKYHCPRLQKWIDHLKKNRECDLFDTLPRRDQHKSGMKRPGPRLVV